MAKGRLYKCKMTNQCRSLTFVTLPTLPLPWPEMTFTVSPVRIGIGSRSGLPFFVSG